MSAEKASVYVFSVPPFIESLTKSLLPGLPFPSEFSPSLPPPPPQPEARKSITKIVAADFKIFICARLSDIKFNHLLQYIYTAFGETFISNQEVIMKLTPL
jgi:hypothetical protein